MNSVLDADGHSEPVRLLCPYCGNSIEKADFQSGQIVSVKSYPDGAKPEVGDVCVFRNPNKGFPEVKRIVAGPNQRLRISHGDLFLDDKFYQKSASQFLRSRIPIQEWKIETHESSVGNPSTSVEGNDVKLVRYHHSSLWPRNQEKVMRHASPILDEYHVNPNESRLLVPVTDYGVSGSAFLKANQSIDAPMTVLLSTAGHVYSAEIKSQTSTIPKVDCHFSFLVAYVDGRVVTQLEPLTTNRDFALTIDVRESDEAIETESIESASPIAIRYSTQLIGFTSAQICRDIHYRGPNGEIEFEISPVDGYLVLGDNVSNSIDSRTEYDSGISPHWIVGKIE